MASLLRRDGNSFGLVRFALACIVILSHARTIGGYGPESLADGAKVTAGRIAVYGFFAISGFLVSHSYATGSSLWRYSRNRALRILPGFLACLLVTAFVLAPVERMLEGKSLEGVVQDAATFLRRNWALRIHDFHVGELLLDRPLERNFVGPLWTLVYEARCYGIAAVLGLLTLARRPAWVGVAWLGSLAVYCIESTSPGTLQPHSPIWVDPYLVELLPHFLFGCFAWSLREAMPLSSRLAIILSGLDVLAWWAAPTLLDLACTVTVPYLALFVSGRAPWRSFGADNDISYGTYLYGFQSQQMLATVGAHHLGYPAFALLSVVATMPLAVCSWKFVERPFLRRRQPATGARTPEDPALPRRKPTIP